MSEGTNKQKTLQAHHHHVSGKEEEVEGSYGGWEGFPEEAMIRVGDGEWNRE